MHTSAMKRALQIKRRITISIDPLVHDKAKTLAKSDRRGLSNYIEVLLVRELARLSQPEAA